MVDRAGPLRWSAGRRAPSSADPDNARRKGPWLFRSFLALGHGRTEEIPYFKNQERLTFARCGITDPLSIEDLAMTVYHQLGIAGEKKLLAPGNRPIDIVREGSVRKDLIA